MADIVNLRQARKARDRAAAKVAAAENRTRFGRTKAERGSTGLEQARQQALLDGHALPKPLPGEQ